MKKLNLILILIIPILYQCNNKQDIEIKQWRGNNRDGIYNETRLLKEWPENGPELLWSTDSLSMGNSSVSIAYNTIYLTGTIDTLDELIALDMQGNIKWRKTYGRTWVYSFPESRCTPTIDEGKIYVTSGFGDLACFNAISGEIIWKVNATEKYEAKFNNWGIAESPLIIDDKVIFTSAGKKTTVVALNKLTGEEVWASKSIQDSTAYVSPILVQYAGKKIIVNVTSSNLIGVNAQDGSIMWNYNIYDIQPESWKTVAPIINCVSPLYNNGEIYITSGYDDVGAMFKLSPDASNIKLMWVDTVLDTHHGGVLVKDGYIYGSNWLNNREGNWCCIDWNTGKTKYETKWETKGPIIYADGMLYCYDEMKGNLALVKATPKEFKVESFFKIPLGTGPHWSHPVINKGILYVRHGKALMAYNIKKK